MIARALVLVLATCFAAQPAAGQDDEGMLNRFNGRQRQNPATDPPTTPPPPAAPAADERKAAFDRRIASLRASQVALTVDRFANVAAARARAADLRRLVDLTRRDLYLPDPGRDTSLTTSLNAFRARWGALADAILTGRRPDAAVPQDQWTAYARGFSRTHCGDQVVQHLGPPNGMPLRGWAWTCLSDRFFHELAQIEAGVAKVMADRRRIVTSELETMMQRAELLLQSVAPGNEASPRLLQRTAELLNEVAVVGIGHSIRSLEMQRDAGEPNEAFRWLVAKSPVVRRPEVGGRLTVSVGGATTETTVGTPVPPHGARLARDLHRAHWRLAALQASDSQNRTAIGEAERERARALMAHAEAAR